MPTVLITGINGFVAVHTAVVFLRNGWTVRGTVRSAEKGEKVRALPALKEGVDSGKVETVVVEDLIEGDFTNALKGVDAIAHCASPWHFNGKNWESYRDPAVKGTTNIMEQASKINSVKAVSVVSSFAAIGDFSKPATEQTGKVYTEKDWLPLEENDVKDLKAEEGGAVQWYCLSKKLAEKAAREFEGKGQFSVATVNPPVILGPVIHYGPGTTAKDLANSDVSTTDTFNAIASGKDGKVPETPFPIYADVRNVADTLYESIAKKQSGRFPLCNDSFTYQGLSDKAKELYPELAKADQIPTGKPGSGPDLSKIFKLDGSKAEKELGIKYISKEQMLKDTMDSLIVLNIVKAE